MKKVIIRYLKKVTFSRRTSRSRSTSRSPSRASASSLALGARKNSGVTKNQKKKIIECKIHRTLNYTVFFSLEMTIKIRDCCLESMNRGYGKMHPTITPQIFLFLEAA